MSSSRDDDLRDLLDELEDDLERLRSELDDDRGRDRAGGSRSRRSSPLPRPPRPGAFFRFTEQYTIPTVISLLEATIQSLELLRGVLRLADPGRSLDGDREASGVQTRLNDARRFAADRATDQVSRTLDDLRTALSEADLPEEPESRSLIEEIRDLSAEIEDRIAESAGDRDGRDSDGRDSDGRDDRERRRGGTDRDRPRDDAGTLDGGVSIDVSDERHDRDGDDGGAAENGELDGDGDDDDPQVDIESELDSIRKEVRGEDAEEGGDESAADEDADGDSDGTDDGSA